MKSWPREHARRESFRSISSDASSICHKTSSKLFLVIDILHLVLCFKICFNLVLPLPTESSVNWSNKHVFVKRNCKELCGKLRRWYLVNEHGDLLFLFYILKHCTTDNNLWKFDKNHMLNFISGEWPWETKFLTCHMANPLKLSLKPWQWRGARKMLRLGLELGLSPYPSRNPLPVHGFSNIPFKKKRSSCAL